MTRSSNFDSADFRPRKVVSEKVDMSVETEKETDDDSVGQERNYVAGYAHGLFIKAGGAEIRAVTGEPGFEPYFIQGEKDALADLPPAVQSPALLEAFSASQREKARQEAGPAEAAPPDVKKDAKQTKVAKPATEQSKEAPPAEASAKAAQKKPPSKPARATDDQIVINTKARLRAAVLKVMPEYLLALIADTQPSPEEIARYNNYKQQADILRAAETIEGAVAAVVTAINPIAGAVAGVAAAATSATMEVMAKDIDRYVAPWTLKNSGLTGDNAVKSMQKVVYTYRGFTSINYGDAPNRIYGIRVFSNAQKSEEFDDYIDSLLDSASKALQIPMLSRYFCVNVITEKLPLADRDNEKRDNYAGRVVAQYLPSELEKIIAEIPP